MGKAAKHYKQHSAVRASSAVIELCVYHGDMSTRRHAPKATPTDKRMRKTSQDSGAGARQRASTRATAPPNSMHAQTAAAGALSLATTHTHTCPRQTPSKQWCQGL
jgi:hypothetical protein